MDIGVPYRDLGPVDVGPVVDLVKQLPEEAWTRNSFRQDVLADKAHNSTRAIIFKHEWHRWVNPWRIRDMEDLVRAWAKQKGIDPAPFMPEIERETDVGPIYVFPEWKEYASVIGPLVDQAVNYVRTATGVVVRIALVWMEPSSRVNPHIDGQPMAARAHRLHVPIFNPPGVEYKIGGRKLTMRLGRVYDFNNRIQHSTRHTGKRPRVNLFIDYYPNPGVYVETPFASMQAGGRR